MTRELRGFVSPSQTLSSKCRTEDCSLENMASVPQAAYTSMVGAWTLVISVLERVSCAELGKEVLSSSPICVFGYAKRIESVTVGREGWVA